MRFQGRLCPEKYKLGQIKNDQLEAIIDFDMGNIVKTLPDSKTIIIKQNVWFQGGIFPEKYQKMNNLGNSLADTTM